MVRVKGPGPKYLLPPTTGIVNHDPTFTQAPAFSFGVKTVSSKLKVTAPGPKYDVSSMNQRGKLDSQQTSILGRQKPLKVTRTPGPKSYSTAQTDPSAPAFSLGHKRPDMRKSKLGPGPNKYPAPTCIGPHIPDKKAEPAYSILSRNITRTKNQTPGPKYMLPENTVYLNAPPRAPLLGKRKQKLGNGVPGPNKYNPTPTYVKREALKGISFGVQHSTEKHLVYFPEDKVPEAFVF